MKIKPYASNMTVLELNDGTEVLFSYQTPVACYTGSTFYKTERFYSATTTRHVNKWLSDAGVRDVKHVETQPQDFFNSLAD